MLAAGQDLTSFEDQDEGNGSDFAGLKTTKRTTAWPSF